MELKNCGSWVLPAPRLFFYALTCVRIPTNYINSYVTLKAIVWCKQKLDTMPKSIQLMRSAVIILRPWLLSVEYFFFGLKISLLMTSFIFSCRATTWSNIPNQTVSSSTGFRAPLQQCQNVSSILWIAACLPWHQLLWTPSECTGACCTRPWGPPQSTGI